MKLQLPIKFRIVFFQRLQNVWWTSWPWLGDPSPRISTSIGVSPKIPFKTNKRHNQRSSLIKQKTTVNSVQINQTGDVETNVVSARLKRDEVDSEEGVMAEIFAVKRRLPFPAFLHCGVFPWGTCNQSHLTFLLISSHPSLVYSIHRGAWKLQC